MSNWIFLRGLMRESRHWGDFPETFRKVTRVDNIVAPDIPGNGRLNQLQSPASIEAMVEWVRADLQRQQIMPPYSMLALSMGAMVAVAWAEKYPEELQRIVLINTSVAGYSPFYYRLRPENYAGVLFFMLFRSAMARQQQVMRLTSRMARFSRHREAILAQWLQFAKENPVSMTNVFRQLLAAMRFRAGMRPPAMPVLLLCSQHDDLVNVQCSVTLCEKWQAEIRMHPVAGHDLPLDDGEWVAEMVKDWME